MIAPSLYSRAYHFMSNLTETDLIGKVYYLYDYKDDKVFASRSNQSNLARGRFLISVSVNGFMLTGKE